MKQQQQPEVLTPEEATKQLRVHPATVYRLLRSGHLPGTKVGQQWHIRRADLDRLHTANDQPTPQELEESRRA